MKGMTRRAGASVLTGGTLLVLLMACSVSWTFRGSGSSSASSGSSAGSASAMTSTSSTGVAAASAAVSVASCSGNTCTVTLAGKGSRVQVLGTSISFGGIRDGRATVRVGNRDVSLAQGRTVSVERLVLRCTGVTRDAVTMVGSLA
jgi:hypothetical protein